jgi:OFA family oxalate/formate antiporter-like MFS transporter
MTARSLPFSRWWLVVISAGAIGVVGTYQFVWSSIRGELGLRLAASEAALGTVFTVFIVVHTVAMFPAGRFRDRHGPKIPLVVGAVLLAVGYVGTAYATVIWQVYLFYALGGVGFGVVYTVAVNTPVKWFSDRRGLATGAVTMAFGGVSVLIIPLVRGSITTDFRMTLLALGVLSGLVCLLGVPFMRDPETPIEADREDAATDGGDTAVETGTETDGDAGPAGDESAAAAGEVRAYTWRETVRTWQFWVLYLVMFAVNGVGLMVIGKAVVFAETVGLSAAVATAAASAIALGDSAGIVVLGGLSDRLGRERTIGASLACSGIALAGATLVANEGVGVGFILLVFAMAFFRSPTFSVFPSLVGEYYGTTYSSENYALVYSAKIPGGILGGVAASAAIAAVGWTTSFVAGAGLLLALGAMAFLLRPV